MGAGFGPLAINWPEPPNPDADQGLVTDEVRNPPVHPGPQGRCPVLQGQPCHPAPARRLEPLDQRRHPAPVDHPGRRDHPLAPGRQRQPRTGHADSERGGAGMLVADDGCMTFYYTNQQSARLMFYHDHAFGTTRLNVYLGEAAGYLISDDTEKSLTGRGSIPGAADTDPAHRPGPDLRSWPRAARCAGPDLGFDPLGWLRRLLVPPRLHAGAESGRSLGHERLWALDVRALLLAAGDAAARAHPQPVLQLDPRTWTESRREPTG